MVSLGISFPKERYGIPILLSSGNGPVNISQVMQLLVRTLRKKWKLHCAYRLQISGQVKHMNRTLKETLTKLTMETGGNWVALLPFALFQGSKLIVYLGINPV